MFSYFPAHRTCVLFPSILSQVKDYEDIENWSFDPTLQAQWMEKCRIVPTLAHWWSHSPRRHSWCMMWSRSEHWTTIVIQRHWVLAIVCKVVPQLSTIPRSAGGDFGVGGHDVPHLFQSPRLNSVGGSTFPQWQNWRSLNTRALLAILRKPIPPDGLTGVLRARSQPLHMLWYSQPH